MHERHDIEVQLKKKAIEIQRELGFGRAPVVVIMGGITVDREHRIPRTMVASAFPGREHRLRDLLGLLETAIQIETLKHFNRLWGLSPDRRKEMMERMKRAREESRRKQGESEGAGSGQE